MPSARAIGRRFSAFALFCVREMTDQAEKHFQREAIRVHVFPDRSGAGTAAAADVARRLIALGRHQDEIPMIFAAAPSQNEFLAALVDSPGVPWNRIVAFHLDEYLGLPPDSDQRFG